MVVDREIANSTQTHKTYEIEIEHVTTNPNKKDINSIQEETKRQSEINTNTFISVPR